MVGITEPGASGTRCIPELPPPIPESFARRIAVDWWLCRGIARTVDGRWAGWDHDVGTIPIRNRSDACIDWGWCQDRRRGRLRLGGRALAPCSTHSDSKRRLEIRVRRALQSESHGFIRELNTHTRGLPCRWKRSGHLLRSSASRGFVRTRWHIRRCYQVLQRQPGLRSVAA